MSCLKMNFEYFQIRKWILQTARSEIVDEKSGHLSCFLLSYGPEVSDAYM